jgi:hypothetical protein
MREPHTIRGEIEYRQSDAQTVFCTEVDSHMLIERIARPPRGKNDGPWMSFNK